MSTKQSYQDFLNQNLTDRTKQRAYFDQVRASDTRFHGLDEKTQANILADVSGFEPFRRFAQGGVAQTMDSFGNFMFNSASDLRPADFNPLRQGQALMQYATGGSELATSSPALEKPVSGYTGDASYGLSKMMGASDSTAAAFRTGGELLPNVAAQMGMLIGGTMLAPVTGGASLAAVPASFAGMYGQGLDQAYSQGEFGAKAHAVASIGPLASAATMGLARPLGAFAANRVMSLGTSEAIKAGMKQGGELGLKSVMANTAVGGTTKAALKASQEAIVLSAQAGIGISASMAQNVILDPKMFFSETIKSKEFWIPTLMSEVAEGVGGTIAGRLRKPLPEAPERVAATEAEAQTVPENIDNPAFDPRQPDSNTNRPTISNPAFVKPTAGAKVQTEESVQVEPPLYDAQTKVENDVDPLAEDSDKQLLDSVKQDEQAASGVVLDEQNAAKTAQVNPEHDPAQPESPTNPLIIEAEEPLLIQSPTQAVDNVARGLTAKGAVETHENVARRAMETVGQEVDDAPAGVKPEQAVSNTMEQVNEVSGKWFKDHHFATGEVGNHIALRNPGTAELGVLVHFVRGGAVQNKGSAEVASKLILKPEDLLFLDPVNSRAAFDLRSGMADKMTDSEWQTLVDMSNGVKQQHASLPYGVSFADGHDAVYVQRMTDYLNRSGIQSTLIAARRKLRFGMEARKISQDTIKDSPLDYFFAMNKATSNIVHDVDYISRNEGFAADSDPHELGHTVGNLIRTGSYGEKARAEWTEYLNRVSKMDDDGTIAKGGAKLAADLGGSKYSLPEQIRQHYRKAVEIEAQVFQGYFLSKENPMTKWIAETFPTLHGLFKQLMKALNVTEDAAKTAERMDMYSPGYIEGRMIMSGILGSDYTQTKVVTNNLKKFITRHKLQGKAVDAVTSAWYAKISPEAHEIISQNVSTWKEGLLTIGKPTESEYADLADVLSQLAGYYKSNPNGQLPAGEAAWGMPWMRRLAGGDMQEIRTAIEGVIRDPKILSKLNEVFLSPEELKFLRDRKGEMRDQKVIQRARILQRNKKLLQLNARNVSSAISEILAKTGEHRVSGAQVTKQMFQIDNVIKKWMLGRLKGQNSEPFFDLNNHIMATELSKSVQSKVASAHTFHRWFPILSKALEDGITKSKAEVEMYVSEDGQVNEKRVGGKNTKRKSFSDELDAVDYKNELSRQAAYNQYQLRVRPEVNKKTGETKYHVYATKVQKDTRYVEEMTDMRGWQEEMMGLMNKETQRTANPQDTRTVELNAFAEFDTKMRELREAFIREKGPAVMQDLANRVPFDVKQMIQRGYLNENYSAQVTKFRSWLQDSADNQMRFSKFAEHFGLKSDAKPSDVVEAWLALHLDKGKEQQKQEAIKALADISPQMGDLSGIHDYIMSMHNFAKSYTRASINRAMTVIEKPQVNGQVPDINPNEFKGEARLANTHIMNNADIAHGVALAIAATPGGMLGRRRAIAQTETVLKHIMGKPLGVIQKLHLLIGAGPVHHSMANPAAKQLGQFIYEETGRASAWVQETFEPLFGTGELQTDINGNSIWVNKPVFKQDKESAIYKIESTPKLKEQSQAITFLEQEASMAFEKLLRGDKMEMKDAQGKPTTNEKFIARAKELLAEMTPEEFQTHREGLARRYAGQNIRVRREAEMENYNHIASFALGLNTYEQFTGRATEAHDFAQKFSELPSDQKVQSLVNTLNMLEVDAIDVVLKYTKVEDALMQKHQKMFEHLEYVTETRLKDFHVGVVFKANKDGSIPAPGYYDFNTAEEAYAFIEDQKKLGNKVPKSPKDFSRQRWNYKPMSGSLHEIIARVAEERSDLIQTILYKKIGAEDMTKITQLLDHIPSDISNENDVVIASKSDAHRKFVTGRENLDMIDQFRKSTQRRAAAFSRRRTDILFKLYENDEALIKDRTLYNIMDSFREGVRQKDTEAQKTIGQAGFVMYIMGNVSSALIEVFQFPITMSPILLENGASIKDAYAIPAKMMKMATHAAMRRLKSKSSDSVWTGEYLAMITEAERQGRLNQRKHHDLLNPLGVGITDALGMLDSASGEVGAKSSAMHIGKMTYDFLNETYGFFNRINAELSLVSAYEVLKKTQYGKNAVLTELQTKELQNRAMQISDTANGSLQRLGRPSFFNTKREGQRNAASMYWSLQSFVNAQVANQLRFMQKSINADSKFTKAESTRARKAFVGLLGAQFLGMGFMGFTLMPAMAKIVQELFGYDMEDELRDLLYNDEGKTASERAFMGEVASNGLMTALGVPVDYGTRISVGGIGPLSGFQGVDANQIGGPLIGLATSAIKDLAKVRSGDLSLAESGTNLLPMGLRRGVKMSFFDDGKVADSNKRAMFQASGWEQFGSWLGFNTTRARKEMKTRMERDEATKGDSSAKSRLANAINRAQNESPTHVQQMLLQGAQEFSMKPYDFASYVAGKKMDKILGPAPREGAGPRSVQAKKLYPSPLGNPSQLQRQLGIYDTLQRMGVAPRVSNTALNNAAQLDYMMQLNPSMTRGTAGHMMRENPMMKQGFSQLLGGGF